MYKCGLFLIHSPFTKIPSTIGHFLNEAKSLVSQVLYVKIVKTLNTTEVDKQLSSSSEQQQLNYPDDNHFYLPSIYRAASSKVPHLDVRVIIKSTLNDFHHQPQILLYNNENINPKNFPTLLGSQIDPGQFKEMKKITNPEESADCPTPKINGHNHVCLGGTFDYLHNGHKVLLSESLIRSKKSMTIGITDVSMVKKKILWELIQPLEKRMDDIRDFLTDCCDSIEYKIVGITDPFGPAIVDSELSCIVVSQETLKGGEKINSLRKEKNMKELEIVCFEMVKDEAHESQHEEDKISSSSLRMRKLGTLIRKPPVRENIPRRPYRIGLVGGICSGKSTICQHLSEHDIFTISADVLAHQTYSSPKAIAYSKLVKAFGTEIINPTDESIDRRKLGSIVFADKTKLSLLNSIIWPATKELIEQRFAEVSEQHEIVVLEAALLFEAGWEDQFHQIWTSIVSEEEAIRRLKIRNNLTEEEARQRVASQISNYERVQRANVVFSSQWERDFTQKQVDKAVAMLHKDFLS